MPLRFSLILISVSIALLLALPATGQNKRGFKPKLIKIALALTGTKSAWKAKVPENLWARLKHKAKIELKLGSEQLIFQVLPGKTLSRNELAKTLLRVHKSLRIADGALIGKVDLKLAKQPRRQNALALWRALKSTPTVKSVPRPKGRNSKLYQLVIVSPGITLGALNKTIGKSLGRKSQRKDPIGDLTWHGPAKKTEKRGSGRRGSGGE